MSTPNPDIKAQEDKTKNEDKTTNEDKKKVIDFFTSGSVVEGRRWFKPKRVEIDTEKDKITIHFDDNNRNINMKEKIAYELADIGYQGNAECSTSNSKLLTLAFTLLPDNSTRAEFREKEDEREISFTLERQHLLNRIDNFYQYDQATIVLIDLLDSYSAVAAGTTAQDSVKSLIAIGADVTKPIFKGGSIITRIIGMCDRSNFNFGLLELLVSKGAKPDSGVFQRLKNLIEHFELNHQATVLKNIGRALQIFHKYGFSIPPLVTKVFEDNIDELDTTDAEKKGFKEFIALMREPLPMAPWAPMPKDLEKSFGFSTYSSINASSSTAVNIDSRTSEDINVDTNADANDDTKEKTSPRAKN